MNEIKEKRIKDYPEAVTLKSTKIILKQMEKNICKILNDRNKGTGFFCKIPFPDNNNKLSVLITNNHVINDLNKNIKIYYDNKIIEIELENRKKYTNKEYDITIIEIKEKDKIEEYLEIDEEIMKRVNKINLEESISIYVLQYPEEKLVSYGILNGIIEDKKYNFSHLCCTDKGSSGSPIINLKNNKVIGIHLKEENNFNIGLFLNYPIQEFINKYNDEYLNKREKIRKELEEKFNFGIGESECLYKLDFSCKGLENEEIEYLYNFEFPNLEELILRENQISDIKVLEKVKFENLKELDLSENQISDIKVLEKVKFENLEKLYLNHNQISDIKVLEKVKFKNLEELYLNHNQISDIKVLEKVEFENLEGLYLGANKISDIKVLEKVKFENLKELYLYDNEISDIKVLEKVKFENLEILSLADNQISDIKVLENVIFENLEKLYLGHNKISDIKVLEKVKFENLEELDLYGNQIDKNEYPVLIQNLNKRISEFNI